MDVPMHYIYMLFPITFTLMSIRIVQTNILKYVLKRELKDGDDITSEMEDIRQDMKIDPENEGRSS